MNSADFSRRIDQAREPSEPTDWWSGRCPAHDDEKPSLGWVDGTVKIGIKCQAGCSREEVLAALRLTEDDTCLRPRPASQSGATARTVAATYDYRDESGVLLFQSVRYEPKDFRQRRPDPDDANKWTWNMRGVRLVLYRLNELQGQRRVVVVEGEKDADRLAATGLAATCNPMGAGKWRDEYAEQLRRAGCLFVTVIPDSDDAGREHADRVMRSCVAADLVVQVVSLSEEVDGERRWLGDKEDVSDYLDRNSVDDLYEVLFRADGSNLAVLNRSDRTVSWPDDVSRLRADGAAKITELEAILRLDALLGAPPTPYGEPPAEPPRRDVDLSGDPYEDMKTMWRELVEANEPPVVFLYGDMLSKMNKDAAVVGMDVDRFRGRLVSLARFVKQTKSGPKPVKPEVDLLKMMLVSDENLARMPQLRRIVRTPVFSEDGRLIQRPGHDAESGVYLELADGLVVPPVSEVPTQDEVDRARSLLLDDVFVDFPFTSKADKAAVVALTLLPFARDLIDGATPLHVIAAAKPGTGKSLLLEAVTTIAIGRGVGSMTEADDEDETRKRITSQLLAEPTYVVFENLNKMMRGGAVAQAITGTTWQDRILGLSKIVNLPVRCCWIAVANNPAFSPEVADRIVTCRMVSPLERPRNRDLKDVKHKYLAPWVRENRGPLVWSCLTLVQNWIARGRRKGSADLGSFQTWAETMSGILEAAGVPGLLDNRQMMLERADPVGDSRKAFVVAWYADFKLETKYPRDLVALADLAGCPVDASKTNKDGSLAQSERSRIGTILNQLVDQVFVMPDGVSVTVAPGDPPRDRNGARYRLLVVGPQDDADEYLGGRP